MEENKPLVTETEYPDSDTDIISGDGAPIIDTSDQNVDTAQEESNTSKSDSEENTENSSTTNTEENGTEEDTTTEVSTDPANDPATLESALLVSTYAALSKLSEYVPTEYVNNSEPDIDAEHLNNTEQGLLRVTNLLNGAVDVINDLQTTVAKQAGAIETLNSNCLKNTSYIGTYDKTKVDIGFENLENSIYGDKIPIFMFGTNNSKALILLILVSFANTESGSRIITSIRIYNIADELGDPITTTINGAKTYFTITGLSAWGYFSFIAPPGIYIR